MNFGSILNNLLEPRLPEDYQTEFDLNLNHINYIRTRLFARLLLLIDLILIIIDYFNEKTGLWLQVSNYRILFYSHLALGFMILVIMYLSRKRVPNLVNFNRTAINIGPFFAFYILILCAIISGYIDQTIQQEITVYILGCFIIAIIFIFKPKISLTINLVSYLTFLFLITENQKNSNILQGDYINGTISFLLALLISVFFYKYRKKEFINTNKLEDIVFQRTKELKDINLKLKEEIKERKLVTEYLDKFFNASADGLCIMDFNGFIIKCNPSFYTNLGFFKQEISLKNIKEIIYFEDLNKNNDLIKNLLKGQSIDKLELRLITKDKDFKWYEWVAVPDTINGLIFAIARDVTERKKTQSQVRRLLNIIQSINDGIGIIGMNLSGEINEWNLGAKNILGYDDMQIIGKSFYTVFQNNPEVIDAFEKAKCGERVTLYDDENVNKNRQIIFISLTFSPIRKDDLAEIIGVSVIIRDTTDKVKFENELKRLQYLDLIGQMSASISHEVRNPMTTVKGFLQLINNKEWSMEYKEYFEIMISELDRANEIITEFLSINSKAATILEPNNINTILRALFPLIYADGIELDISVDLVLGDIPDLLLNQKEIRQLILNLVRNGLEAMSKKGGHLIVKTYSTDMEVILEVKDEGEGIDPGIIEKLGTPFFTTKDKGTGLGLAVCYGIAARHNAKIKIKTSSGGTSFLVHFEKITYLSSLKSTS